MLLYLVVDSLLGGRREVLLGQRHVVGVSVSVLVGEGERKSCEESSGEKFERK